MNYDTIKNQIDTIQNEGRDLTEWEEDFIKSVVGQFKMKGWLSPKQAANVERIYTERCPTGSPFGEERSGIIQRNISRMDRIRNEGRPERRRDED